MKTMTGAGPGGAAPAAEPSTARPERRNSRRAKILQWVRVRPSDPEDDDFDEVRATVSVSRKGLYFTTWCSSYYTGMRLFVTYPYSPDPSAMNGEYIGQVVRTEVLGGGLLGVGVQLVLELGLNPSSPAVRPPRRQEDQD